MTDNTTDASVLVRRCGVQHSEAVFLLEAAGGDVRKALSLQESYSSWAGDSLTNATLVAMSRASPPGDSPSSPLPANDDVLADKCGGCGAGRLDESWPTMRQTAAALEDWALIDAAGAPPSDDDWIDVGDVDSSPAALIARPTFLEKAAAPPPPQQPTRAAVKAGRVRSRPAISEPAQFDFDDEDDDDDVVFAAIDLGGGRQPMTKGGHRDGHTKHTKKAEQTKAERRGKRAQKKAARHARRAAAANA